MKLSVSKGETKIKENPVIVAPMDLQSSVLKCPNLLCIADLRFVSIKNVIMNIASFEIMYSIFW